VDGGPSKRYPFAFCTEVGCFSQVGFTADDVNAFRRGARATLSIVPAGAPEGTSVTLAVSLSGFTAGFAVLEEVTAAAIEANTSTADQ
jgi:invasion protein IalB